MTLVARSESGYRAGEGAKLGEQEHIEHRKIGAVLRVHPYFITVNINIVKIITFSGKMI